MSVGFILVSASGAGIVFVFYSGSGPRSSSGTSLFAFGAGSKCYLAPCLDEVTKEATNTTFMGEAQMFLIYQTTVLCNKRCSLTHYAHHLDCLKDMY